MYIRDSRKRKRQKRRNRILFLALLAAIAVAVAMQRPGLIPNPFQPTPTPTPAPATFLRDAELAYQEGRLIDAVTVYQSYLALAPEDGLVWAQLARLPIPGRISPRRRWKAPGKRLPLTPRMPISTPCWPGPWTGTAIITRLFLWASMRWI